ncbi:MAG: histidine phosphatase family protein [Alphaproteobacteria bacterium]|nr:histidine phosphatase family protein [Alphaproteobacteria bacterium]MBV9692372.1 histidine phosphatase family protein [Alphaproteobacteria bacterium]
MKAKFKLADGITLYFARHGETEANVEKRFQGHSLNTPLTHEGRKQAKQIARILEERARPKSLSYVASPMQRARETMELVRKQLGLEPGRFSTDARITEIDLGLWDGLTHEQARALDPKLFDRRDKNKWSVRPPGGENYGDVSGRAQLWLDSLTRDTFAVSHGAFTRILRGLFQGLSGQEISDLDEPQGVVFRVQGSSVKRFNAP